MARGSKIARKRKIRGTFCILAYFHSRIIMMPRSSLPTPFNKLVRVSIWRAAADLEQDMRAKKRVLCKGFPIPLRVYSTSSLTSRPALADIPNSDLLWKETVNLKESATDARILLSRAIKVIPLSLALWLASACLEARGRQSRPEQGTGVRSYVA
jgi:hypothetical protein